MRNVKELSIPCVNCGEENNYIDYLIVDKLAEPLLYEAIMNDSIFMYHCGCGYQEYYHHPLIYIDREMKFIVVYSENRQRFKDAMRVLRRNGLFTAYKVRLCANWFSFKEKIYLFEHQRDDRIIALYKELLLHDFARTHPEAGETKAFYDLEEGAELMVVVSEKYPAICYHFPEVWYQSRLHDHLLMNTLYYDDTPYVDDTYVRRFYDHQIRVKTVKVLAEGKTKEYVLSYFDTFKKHDQLVIVNQCGRETPAEVLSIERKDAVNMRRGVAYLSYRAIIPEESSMAEKMKEVLESITHYMNTTQLMELMGTTLDCDVFLPVDIREDDISYAVLSSHDHHSYAPVYLRRQDAVNDYPDARILYLPFALLTDLSCMPVDGFIIEPHQAYRFIAEERFLELLTQYRHSLDYQVN